MIYISTSITIVYNNVLVFYLSGAFIPNSTWNRITTILPQKQIPAPRSCDHWLIALANNHSQFPFKLISVTINVLSWKHIEVHQIIYIRID